MNGKNIVKTPVGILFAASLMLGCATGAAEPKPRIVCFGDSLTSCGGAGGRYSDWLQKALPGYEVVNRGKGGDTLAGGLARLEAEVLSLSPRLVVLGLGANDYWRRKRPLADLKRDYESIVSQCRAAGARVLVISCFGNEKLPEGESIDFSRAGVPLKHYAAGLAVIERELVMKYGCGYVPDMQCGILPKGRRDLWSDSNHPNKEGNRIVAETLLPELRKLLDRESEH